MPTVTLHLFIILPSAFPLTMRSRFTYLGHEETSSPLFRPHLPAIPRPRLYPWFMYRRTPVAMVVVSWSIARDYRVQRQDVELRYVWQDGS